MAEIVSGLFGLPPEDIRKQLQQEQLNFATQFANTYNNEYDKRNALLGGMVGNAVANLGAGLFGVQDPRLKRATDLEGILQSTQQELGGDVNNPAVLYPALQKKLADAGFSREAMQVGQVGQKAIQDARLNQATIAEKEASAIAKTREKLGAFAQTLLAAGLKPGSEEWNKAMKDKIEKETYIAEKTVTPENKAEAVKLKEFTDKFGEVIGSTLFLEWKNELEQRKAASYGTGKVFSASGKELGGYSDKGDFKVASGEVIPKEQMIDYRNSQDAASNLLSIMTNITPADINNAFGKPNVTGGGVASALTRFAANPEVTSAQTKINSLGVKEVLTNLQQLKGASSDKEMSRVASTFPGFEAPPKVMEEWLARAVLTTTKFLNKNKSKYGFDAPSVNLQELASIPVLKSLPATERAKFIEDLAKYDENFKALPENEKIKVLNSIVSEDKPKGTSKQITRTGKVKSGANAGKTVIEYSDGTREYK